MYASFWGNLVRVRQLLDACIVYSSACTCVKIYYVRALSVPSLSILPLVFLNSFPCIGLSLPLSLCYLHSMCGWWSVLVTLPVLLASAQGPSYGCCYNNTLVASPPLDPTTSLGQTATPTASVQFSSSVVENGKCISIYPLPLGTQREI